MTLAAPSGRTITLDYTTANSTAVSGRDYTGVAGTLTFAPGTTTQPIAVPVVGDVHVEPTEVFTVTLSNPVWATLADAHAVGTITTDDAFTDPSLTAGATQVRVVHLSELRTNLEALHAKYGLTAPMWTDPTITAGATVVKGVHLTEMRSALNAIYQAAGLTPPTHTDPTITEGATLIKAVHITELRAAIQAVP